MVHLSMIGWNLAIGGGILLFKSNCLLYFQKLSRHSQFGKPILSSILIQKLPKNPKKCPNCWVSQCFRPVFDMETSLFPLYVLWLCLCTPNFFTPYSSTRKILSTFFFCPHPKWLKQCRFYVRHLDYRYVSIYMYIYVYIYICVYIYVYIYMYIYICIYVYIYMYIYISIYLSISIYIYTHVYIYTHTHIYTQVMENDGLLVWLSIVNTPNGYQPCNINLDLLYCM